MWTIDNCWYFYYTIMKHVVSENRSRIDIIIVFNGWCKSRGNLISTTYDPHIRIIGGRIIKVLLYNYNTYFSNIILMYTNLIKQRYRCSISYVIFWCWTIVWWRTAAFGGTALSFKGLFMHWCFILSTICPLPLSACSDSKVSVDDDWIDANCW